MKTNKKIKIGIVGIGNTRSIADDHIQSFLKTNNAEVTAIYTRTIEKAHQYILKNKMDILVCKSYEELLEAIDAVVICTIDNSHVELSRKAIEKGKHVLCEKPFGYSFSDALEVAKYARKTGLVNMVGYNNRYKPGPAYIKELIEEGQIGEIFTYRHIMGANRLADISLPYEWRMDKTQCRAGTIVDFGSHMVDLIYFLMVENTGEIKKVTSKKATMIRERPLPDSKEMKKVTTDDCSTTIMEMQNGAMAVISNSRLGTMHDSIEITGSKGMLSYYSNDPSNINIWMKDKNGKYSGSPEKKAIRVYENDSYHIQGQLFIDAILDEKQFQQDFLHAANILHVLDCMIISSEEDKTVNL